MISTRENTELSSAVDAVWQYFGRWNGFRSIGVCRQCCMNDEQERQLLGIRREDLRPQDLSVYFFAVAHPECGESFRYYLPRIVEFLAFDPDAEQMMADEIERVWERLFFCRNLRDWQQGADDVLQKFCLAVIKVLISEPRHNSNFTLGLALCIFSRGGIDVGPLIGHIEEAPEASRARALALWFTHEQLFVKHDPDSPAKFESHWWSSDHGSDKVLAFISNPERLREMEKAFFLETDATWSNMFSLAEDGLRHNHGMWHQQ